MNMWSEFSTEPKLQKSDTEPRYQNINKVRDSKYVVSFREKDKLVHVGIFNTIEEAIDARDKYKTTGKRSLKPKVTQLTKLPDLLTYYHQSTTPGIEHALLRYAHINCDNHIDYPIPQLTTDNFHN